VEPVLARGGTGARTHRSGDLAPARRARRPASAPKIPEPEQVLEKVRAFAELARAGAYIAGDRRVSRTERSRWRFTFRALAEEARRALAAQNSEPAERAMTAWWIWPAPRRIQTTSTRKIRSKQPGSSSPTPSPHRGPRAQPSDRKRSGGQGFARATTSVPDAPRTGPVVRVR
jgi:hypothetical protein